MSAIDPKLLIQPTQSEKNALKKALISMPAILSLGHTLRQGDNHPSLFGMNFRSIFRERKPFDLDMALPELTGMPQLLEQTRYPQGKEGYLTMTFPGWLEYKPRLGGGLLKLLLLEWD